MSECTHNCESCGENCPSRTGGAPASLLEKPHELSSIKKVIAVVSGKGGVGKSLVTSLMATLMQRRGYQSAILDADVTGPSIPRIFGLKDRAMGDGDRQAVLDRRGLERRRFHVCGHAPRNRRRPADRFPVAAG